MPALLGQGVTPVESALRAQDNLDVGRQASLFALQPEQVLGSPLGVGADGLSLGYPGEEFRQQAGRLPEVPAGERISMEVLSEGQKSGLGLIEPFIAPDADYGDVLRGGGDPGVLGPDDPTSRIFLRSRGDPNSGLDPDGPTGRILRRSRGDPNSGLGPAPPAVRVLRRGSALHRC